MRCFDSVQFLFGQRGVLFGDERLNTLMIKSISLNTLTVAKFFSCLISGGLGLGWVEVSLDAFFGWVCNWVGVIFMLWCLWDGSILGWVGGIRGERVVKPVSLSGSRLVACSCLSSWSLGWLTSLLPCINLRGLFRGHYWWLLMCFVSGSDFYPGDIRKDQLGGLSIRCNPTCIPTPTLETRVGFRYQFVPANFLFVGLGWSEGWVRVLASNIWWPDILILCSRGSWGILGWVNLDKLMLQDLSYRIMFFHGVKHQLYHSGLLWRIVVMYSLLTWLRGYIGSKVSGNVSTLYDVLGGNVLSSDWVWLLKLYGHFQCRQWQHSGAGNPCDCSWCCNLWAGFNEFCKQGHLWFKCCQPSSCSSNREKVKIADNLAMVPQGYLRRFRMDYICSEGAVGRLAVLSFYSGYLNLVDMLDISSVYYRGSSGTSNRARWSWVCCANWGLDSGVELCLVSNEKGWVMHISLLLLVRATHVLYVWGAVVYWLHQTWNHDRHSKSGVLWRIARQRSRGINVIFGWVTLVQRIATTCAPDKSWIWVGHMRHPLMHLISLGSKYRMTWICCCYYLLGPSLLFGFATQAQVVLCLRSSCYYVFYMQSPVCCCWVLMYQQAHLSSCVFLIC
ncbi:hypothetical protein Hanom_Chr00s000789g01661161 [Helianthus anomalus]